MNMKCEYQIQHDMANTSDNENTVVCLRKCIKQCK